MTEEERTGDNNGNLGHARGGLEVLRWLQRTWKEYKVLIRALLLVLIGALIVALSVALAVVAGTKNPEIPAPVLSCLYDWIGYRNVCYYLSDVNEQEGGWEWSREQCSSLGASLVIIRKEWEMEFLQRLRGQADYWVGLRREGERLAWVDGSDFNQTIPLMVRDDCYFLSDGHLGTSGCSQLLPYLCSKPPAGR